MSREIGGVFAAIGGIILVQVFGFSDACSDELLAKAMPLIGAGPGLITTYLARYGYGDVNVAGIRKKR